MTGNALRFARMFRRAAISAASSLQTVDPEQTITLGQFRCADEIATEAFRLIGRRQGREFLAREHFAFVRDRFDSGRATYMSTRERNFPDHGIEVHINRTGMDA